MEEKDILIFCKKIANKRNVTRKEREFIIELCKKYGIELKNNCRNCYIDACLQIYYKIKINITKAEELADETENKFVLKKGVDVIFDGIRINSATINDDLARRVIKLGFSTRYFAKIDYENK